jgi:hypothetical protein
MIPNEIGVAEHLSPAKAASVSTRLTLFGLGAIMAGRSQRTLPEMAVFPLQQLLMMLGAEVRYASRQRELRLRQRRRFDL